VGALLVNPYDIEGVAAALREAYFMPAEERAARMRRIRRSIRSQDVFDWVDSYLRAAITKDLRAFPRTQAAAGEMHEMQLPL
jgi:trehalose 6-phosphate synthase